MLYNYDETVEAVCDDFLVSSLLLDDGMQWEDTTVFFVLWDYIIIV